MKIFAEIFHIEETEKRRERGALETAASDRNTVVKDGSGVPNQNKADSFYPVERQVDGVTEDQEQILMRNRVEGFFNIEKGAKQEVSKRSNGSPKRLKDEGLASRVTVGKKAALGQG